jgi:tripartite-type tricarboxylate transporter receptor subunit TctC
MVAIVEAGRSFAAPPNTPDAILNELRRAFLGMLDSAAFTAEAERQGRPIGYQDPERYVQVIRTALGAPQIVRDILAEGRE